MSNPSPHKQLIDQAAHFAAAVVIIGTASALGAHVTLLSGTVLGFALGFVRELTQEGDPVNLQRARNVITGSSHMLDISFWTLGGALAGIIL